MRQDEWTVILSENDREIASKDVERRELPKREFGIPTQKIDASRSDYRIDYYGLLAEIAVGKVLGVPHNTHELPAGDDGYDLVWRGKRCEVKFTFYPKGHLLTKRREDIRADLFVLVTGDESAMRLLGWTDRMSFIRLGEVKDFGHGPGFALSGKKLKSMNEFDPVQKRLLDMLEPNGGEKYARGRKIESAETV